MPDGDRHDVGETHDERVSREDQSAKEVSDLAGELKGNREELARNLEVERSERARGLETERRERAKDLKGDRIELAKRVRLKGHADVIIVGALLLAVTVIGWVKVNHFTTDLRNAAVEACHRQNVVRQVVNANLRDDIDALQRDKAQQRKSAKTFQASTFELTEAEFDKLIQDNIDRADAVIAFKRVRIKKLPNAPCQSLYPGS